MAIPHVPGFYRTNSFIMISNQKLHGDRPLQKQEQIGKLLLIKWHLNLLLSPCITCYSKWVTHIYFAVIIREYNWVPTRTNGLNMFDLINM